MDKPPRSSPNSILDLAMTLLRMLFRSIQTLDVSPFWEKNRKSNQITLAWRSVIRTANVISHFLSIQWVSTSYDCAIFKWKSFRFNWLYGVHILSSPSSNGLFSPRGCVTWRNLSVKDAFSQVDMLVYERVFQGSALILCRYTKRV